MKLIRVEDPPSITTPVAPPIVPSARPSLLMYHNEPDFFSGAVQSESGWPLNWFPGDVVNDDYDTDYFYIRDLRADRPDVQTLTLGYGAYVYTWQVDFTASASWLDALPNSDASPSLVQQPFAHMLVDYYGFGTGQNFNNLGHRAPMLKTSYAGNSGKHVMSGLAIFDDYEADQGFEWYTQCGVEVPQITSYTSGDATFDVSHTLSIVRIGDPDMGQTRRSYVSLSTDSPSSFGYVTFGTGLGSSAPPGMVYYLFERWGDFNNYGRGPTVPWVDPTPQGLVVNQTLPGQAIDNRHIISMSNPFFGPVRCYPMVRRASTLYGFSDPASDTYHPSRNSGLDLPFVYVPTSTAFEFQQGDRIETWVGQVGADIQVRGAADLTVDMRWDPREAV
jgi:hypothetical protein